jgi:hypothetical protein
VLIRLQGQWSGPQIITLLSSWYLARLIPTWRWRRYTPPKHRLTLNSTRHYIPITTDPKSSVCFFFNASFCDSREGNDPDDYSRLTYRKLLEEVCRFSNVLKSRGVTKGDRVAIYMPMILEVIIAILACSRIGAVHTIVVGKQNSNNLSWKNIIDYLIFLIIKVIWRKQYLHMRFHIANGILLRGSCLFDKMLCF